MTSSQTISGRTLLFPVVGSPIAQVQAPAAFNPLFARCGIDALVVPLELPPAEVVRGVQALARSSSVGGVLVTVPYKKTLCDAVDRLSERARAAGAVIVGTTVSTEYAIGASGPTTNPHDASRTPGGSSSGSAAAVAAAMVPVALGSQTVGSIVRPATYCGVYGLKPTHGAIDASGVMPLSSVLDHIGVLARTPADIALVCRALFDRPSEWVDMAAPRRVHLVSNPMQERVTADSHVALERARSSLVASGASVVSTQLPPEFNDAESCVNRILCRDIATNHGEDRDRAGDQMSAKLRDLVDRGRAVDAGQYAAAIALSRQLRDLLLRLLDDDSIILSAATDGVAPLQSADGTGPPQLQGLYTLAGLPALAVPCGTVHGLPIGVQLVAGPGREGLLVAAANAMGFTCPVPSR